MLILRQEPDWPAYRQVAADIGVRAVAGIPMKLAGTSIGASNLYDTAPREWTRGDLLRRHSRHGGRRVQETAHEIISGDLHL